MRQRARSWVSRARAETLAWLGSRPQALRALARRPPIVLLSVIALVGLGLRVYMTLRWRPALLGFPDSTVYVTSARTGAFNNPLRPAGYAIFLQMMHAIRPHLDDVVIAQHLLGEIAGLLMYGMMRRLGVRDWWAIVPAAVVLLSGSEIFLEHAPLSDSLFAFLVILAMYAIARGADGGWQWPVLAGLSLSAAVDVRTIGLVLLPIGVLAALLLPGRWRWRGRLASAFVVAVSAVPLIAGYLIVHQRTQGYGGFTGAGYYDLYARVAPFADCTKFTPPDDTAKLCIGIPPSQRPGHDVWEFTGMSPAVNAYGGEPDLTAPQPGEDTQLREFAEAAILGQPLDYLEAVGRDLVRVIDPNFPSSPYGNVGPTASGYGSGPEQLLLYWFNPVTNPADTPVILQYYPSDGIIYHSLTAMMTYERDTRLEGPLMALLLALALLAPAVARRGDRRRAGFLLAFTFVLIVGPIALSEYDYRFVIPAFGPLAATSAMGAAAIWSRLRPRVVRLRDARRARREPPAMPDGSAATA